jgi:subtilisin-like proprotein convertase family protein
MKRRLLIAVFAIVSFAGWAQDRSWKPVTRDQADKLGQVKPMHEGLSGKYFLLDTQSLKQALASLNDNPAAEPVLVAIPNASGKVEHYRVTEYSNFSPELQAQFPEIRAYAGKGVDDPSAAISFSLSPEKGISVMVLRGDRSSEFLEPYTKESNVYIAFTPKARRMKGQMPFTCFTQEDHVITENFSTNRNAMSSAGVLKKFRLALSTTGEYTAYHGGVAQAVAAVNTTMTRVNGVFAIDLAVKLELIANNTQLIYANPNTDPYSPATDMDFWNGELQATLTSVIGEANYDIGHLFGASGGGGNAGCIGCVCVNGQKGSGITSPSNNQPEGDTFDIDYVAHEMGHQLGGTHTMTAAIEGAGVSVEPGSGTTIMGYAGITGPTTDVQPNSDDYFSYSNILQIQNNLQNKACAVNTPINNAPMTINAGADYIIPKGTPFVLRAANTAGNAPTVTYCWEQADNATAATAGAQSIVYPTKPNGPNFRSYPPTTSPDRYMPKLEKVLAGNLTYDWESVSTVARTLNFALTGRDNVATGGQTQTDLMQVNVNGTAGPFTVTSQNTPGISWPVGSTQTITWNVAGTTGNGINTSQVNIRLSTDNGQTFSTILAANTPNDGSQSITLPSNISAPFCRIMVEAVNNIYYAVNSQTIAIGYTVTETCNTYSNNTPMPIPDGVGNPALGPVVASNINVPGNSAITEITVNVNVTHTFVQDVIVALNHPDNTQVMLWSNDCTAQNGFNVTFDDNSGSIVCGSTSGTINGTYVPDGELSTLLGKPGNGQWTLLAGDIFAGDTGQVNSWSLNICAMTATAGTNEFGLQDFKIYPNPNNGSFTVEFNSDSSNDVQILVHDMRGRQIMNKSYENSGLFSGNVNLNNVETGVYLVTVQDGNRKEVKRIVVQ